MCGIDGMLRLDPQAPALDLGALGRTRAAQARRGPDGEGEWVSPDGTVALGHRRLAILDLSPAGRQPMVSPDGTHVLILNGEIYNYRELRAELGDDAGTLSSTGDTAVLLALYARHGVAMLRRLRGMFALALWDAPRRRLILARDPHGIKPLYYAVERRTLRFASQVKALEAGGVSRDVDPAGLVGFLLWGAVPEPSTIRRHVRALPAGTALIIDDGQVGAPQAFTTTAVTAPAATAAAAVEDAIRAHLVSDVPVATFLSGGLDSALITAVARRHLSTPPRTFTLRFDRLIGTSADEGPLAADLARRLGCPHEERVLGAGDVAGLWDAGLAAMDQPSIDGFNTFLVSQAAHEAGMKVVLSGLGGDEIFGSYPSFADVPRLQRTTRRLSRIPGAAWAWRHCAALVPGRPKLAGLLRYGQSLEGAYFLRRGLFLPEELPELLPPDVLDEGLARLDDQGSGVPSAGIGAEPARPDPWRAVQHLESTLYMRNQLLRDSDWASMAHSLELRVPLVDAVLSTSLAALDFEPARSVGKAALVRQLAPELPAALFARTKHGFTIPLVEWLRPESAKLRPGQRSRWLARQVLAHWGTHLASSP